MFSLQLKRHLFDLLWIFTLSICCGLVVHLLYNNQKQSDFELQAVQTRKLQKSHAQSITHSPSLFDVPATKAFALLKLRSESKVYKTWFMRMPSRMLHI